MRDEFLKRLDELIAGVGTALTTNADWEHLTGDPAATQAWVTSASHVVNAICPISSVYVREVEQLAKHDATRSMEKIQVQKILGVLKAVKAEAQAGLLQRVEDAAFATAFDDFLDHAEEFHKQQKPKEAAVLMAVVFEDAIKRIAAKNNVPHSGQTLDPLIDALIKASVLTPIKAKRLKAYAGVRNAALHAEWEKVDSKDVGEAIAGVRELLDQFLAD
jgi:uncharacterized protein YutE (UPF0331/DUF86 family)